MRPLVLLKRLECELCDLWVIDGLILINVRMVLNWIDRPWVDAAA